MKKKSMYFACIALLSGAMTLMSFVNSPAVGDSRKDVPSTFETKVIETAKNNGFITEKEAATLEETQAIRQCTDAFVESGYKPSAAVDKLAEISVEKGYFKSKASAKKAMRSAAEKARKSESLWTKLYDILGL